MATNHYCDNIDCQRRQLELVDRVLGLEAEVARLSLDAGVHDIRVLKNSRYWKVGYFLLAPIRWVRGKKN